jgi:hypothetical protein
MKHLLFALLFLSGLVGAEPSTSKDALPVKGKFYYTLDDEARIFVNGTETLHLTRGAGQSKDISLKAGDRVTMQLKNVGGEKFLRLLFVAEDRSVMLPIIRNSFKCLPDPEAKDHRSGLAALPEIREGDIRQKDGNISVQEPG